MNKGEMRISFWGSMFAGLIILFVVVGLVLLTWTCVHEDYTRQTMIQAVYLAEISGYVNDLTPKDSQVEVARQLATETRAIPPTRLNPELLLITKYQGAKDREPGSYILQLHKSHPEAINRTLEGSIEPAEELYALYRATSGLRWLPHGTTLLILFCLGLLIVVIVSSEEIFSLAGRFKERLKECTEELKSMQDDKHQDEQGDEQEGQ